MKLGILGTGKIVQEFLTILHEFDFEYVSILGRIQSREKTEAIAEKYRLQKCFYDYDEMLASDVDTIYVALPNALHFEFTKKALEAGKHVILEKPATVTYEELVILRNLAREKKKILIEAVTTHYLPAFKNMKKEIGQLGEIKIVSLNYSQYSSRYDQFKEGIILPVFDPEQAGGALMDLNVYNLNFAVGLFGAPKQVQYYANIERGIDTSGIMLLDYGSFKAVCIGAKDCKAPLMSSVQGDKGNMIVPSSVSLMTEYTRSDNSGKEEKRDFEDGKHRMYHEFQEFDRIIAEEDFETADQMMEISLDVCKIIETGRRQQNIIFPGDTL